MFMTRARFVPKSLQNVELSRLDARQSSKGAEQLRAEHLKANGLDKNVTALIYFIPSH